MDRDAPRGTGRRLRDGLVAVLATAMVVACILWNLDAPIRLGFVWGRAIPVRREPDLSTPAAEAYVDQVHEQFMAATADLFARHKASFGYGPEETLAFVSAKAEPLEHSRPRFAGWVESGVKLQPGSVP